MQLKKETHRRTIAKTITFRILATLTTMLLVYIFTGNIAMMFSIGALETIAKLIIYYLHERAWNKVSWGISDDR